MVKVEGLYKMHFRGGRLIRKGTTKTRRVSCAVSSRKGDNVSYENV